jgi:hypothetical protein
MDHIERHRAVMTGVGVGGLLLLGGIFAILAAPSKGHAEPHREMRAHVYEAHVHEYTVPKAFKDDLIATRPSPHLTVESFPTVIAGGVKLSWSGPTPSVPRVFRPRTEKLWVHTDGDHVDGSIPAVLDVIRKHDAKLLVAPPAAVAGTIQDPEVGSAFHPDVKPEERIARLREALAKASVSDLPTPPSHIPTEPFFDLFLAQAEFDPAGKLRFGSLAKLKQNQIIVVHDQEELESERKANSEALLLIQKSSNPAPGLLALSDRVTALEVLDGLPRTAEEYMRTYGTAAGDVDLDVPPGFTAERVGVPITRLMATDGATHANGGEIAAQINRKLEEARPDVLQVIMGHVDKGLLHFPDGSYLPTGDLLLKGVIIVGCDTAAGGSFNGALQLLTFQSITFRQARNVVRILGDAVKAGVNDNDPTMEHLLRTFQTTLRECSDTKFGPVCEHHRDRRLLDEVISFTTDPLLGRHHAHN